MKSLTTRHDVYLGALILLALVLAPPHVVRRP